jgi:hypothetical protein
MGNGIQLRRRSPSNTEHHRVACQWSAGGAGLLPGTELAVAGAFGNDPDGIPIADVLALIGGLDWLVESRAPAINVSFAGL